VDTAVALSHAIKKVDAVVPDEAKARKIGGPVIADVTIDASGKVSSLTILSGPELLRPATEKALRQWVFKPFTVNGKPASVQAIVEIDFPDPRTEEENRFQTAAYECRRQLELDASNAEAACAAAIRSAELLPPDRVLERSHALADHGYALMASGRTADAISELERAIATRQRVSQGPDAESADLRQVLAMLHQQLGENEKADAEYAAAIAEYTAALQRLPAMRQAYYESGLRSALTRYAQLKRSVGDAATASALEARAAAIAEPSPSLPALAVTRAVDGIEINEPVDTRLPDEDLGRVRAALAATGKKPWRLQVRTSHGMGTSSDASNEVYAFFAPDVVTPTFRRGTAAFVARLPVSPAKNAPLAWTVVGTRLVYVQIASTAGDAANESPIPVMEAAASSILTDEDLISIVRQVRERAVPRATDKYMSDVQPWSIRDIRQFNAEDVYVTLTDPAHEDHFQQIRFHRASDQWAVVELAELGRRPRK
jgi:TonB family protein